MTFQINQLVQYNGKGTLSKPAGTRGAVKAFTTFGNGQYLKVEGFGEDAFPCEWFDAVLPDASQMMKIINDVVAGVPAAMFPVQEIQIKVDLYKFEFNIPMCLDQMKRLGEWEVRKRIHADLDRAIDTIKADPIKNLFLTKGEQPK